MKILQGTILEIKVLIVFGDMMANMIINKRVSSHPIVTEQFTTSRKQNIFFGFILQPYFFAAKEVKLNTTYFFIKKIQNRRKFQQVLYNHSTDIDLEK